MIDLGARRIMRPESGYCERCGGLTPARWPWYGWRSLHRIWMGGLLLWIPVTPLMMVDFAVSVPLFTMYGMCGGPLGRMAKEPATCLRCGGVVVEASASNKPGQVVGLPSRD